MGNNYFVVESVSGRENLTRLCFDTLKAALEYYHNIYISGYPIRILKVINSYPVAVVKKDWWHLLGSYGFQEI